MLDAATTTQLKSYLDKAADRARGLLDDSPKSAELLDRSRTPRRSDKITVRAEDNPASPRSRSAAGYLDVADVRRHPDGP